MRGGRLHSRNTRVSRQLAQGRTDFEVTIARPYYIGKFEVTQAQYKQVMGTNPSVFQGSQIADAADDHPVDSVTWADAQAFVRS